MPLDEYLEELSNISGISGFEDEVVLYVKSQSLRLGHEVKEDFMKNLTVFLPGRNHDFKIGVFAHTDEVGLMVTKVKEKEGILKFAPVGGVDARVLLAKKVRIANEFDGIIGFKPVHLQSGDEKISIDSLSIYVGENAKNIKPGDPVSFDTKFSSCEDSCMGKAFDDRAGCAIMMQLMQEAKPFYDTYLCFVSQEEIGLRGSAVAASNLELDCALVVEGTTAGDNPELEEEHWATHLGNGSVLVAVHSGYVVEERILERLKELAKSRNVPYQLKRRTAGGTDAARIARTADGIPTGVIAVPVRYIHSPLSLMRKSDLHNTYELVKAFVESEVLPL